MNNKGWGLQEMLFYLCILALAFTISIVMFSQNITKFNKSVSNEESTTEENRKEESKPEEDEKEENIEQTEKKEYKSYSEIETDMKKAAKQYQETIYGEELLEGDKISVTIKSLIKEGYLNKIKDPKNKDIECTGYVTFIKENNKVDYDAYLKCDKNYTTKGYLERLDTKE